MRFPLMLSLFLVSLVNQAQTILPLKDSSAPTNFKSIENAKFKRSLIIPLALIGAGVVGTTSKIIDKYEIKEIRDNNFKRFHTTADNYLQFAPIAMVYGMDLLGFKGSHDFWNQSALLLKSELLMTVIVLPIKKYSHVLRPDSSAYTSFPSGHTAQAFVAAEFLRREYGKAHPWLAVGGYAVATTVGAMRMLNNKHWLPDVLAGAGIGILSVDVVYFTHKNKWPLWTKKLQAAPTYTAYGPGIYLSYHLDK